MQHLLILYVLGSFYLQSAAETRADPGEFSFLMDQQSKKYFVWFKSKRDDLQVLKY